MVKQNATALNYGSAQCIDILEIKIIVVVQSLFVHHLFNFGKINKSVVLGIDVPI